MKKILPYGIIIMIIITRIAMTMQKRSKQREAIIKVLRSTSAHPSAEWIYAKVKKEIPNVGLATVYRNLRLLKERVKSLKCTHPMIQLVLTVTLTYIIISIVTDVEKSWTWMNPSIPQLRPG